MVKRDLKGERFKEFLAEAEDILNSMGKGLLKLGKGVKAGIIDPAVLNGIFRSAHTLKGISGIFDLKDMAQLSHAMEDTLDMLRLGRITLSDDVLDCVMRAYELLSRIIASKGNADLSSEVEHAKTCLIEACRSIKPREKDALGKEFLSILTEYEAHRLRENLKDGKNVFIVNVKFPITSFDKGYTELIETLKANAEVVATLPSSKTDPDTLFFDILIGTSMDREAVCGLIADVASGEVKALAGPATGGISISSVMQPEAGAAKPGRSPQEAVHHRESLRRTSNTVRVNIGKLDNIMSIISEMGMLKSSITRLSAEIRNERALSVYGIELSRVEKNLEKKLSDLRDGVLGVRMVPIGQLFSRFDTFINRLERDFGKEIRITTYGDEVELDKLIIEELADPLMHIIRNVVDHAIEPPDVRQSSGKDPAGAITLSAYQKGNHVVVEVKDDGRGMDEEFIVRKAVEKGLVTEDYVKKLSGREALELVFMPGFSTRDVVSATSGRGVGMDVVKENITRLSGIIDIETVKGKGTRLVLTIPNTLAIIRAIIVEENGARYAVPLNSVIEIIELSARAGGYSPEQECITLNDRSIPAIQLSRFFGKEHAPSGGVCYGIVSGLAEHRLCVIVDALVEELDVVIKPLPRMLKAPGIAGATDMGEKGTILVLDVTGILEMLLKERKAFTAPEAV